MFEPEWELYDLKADPTEVRNVADDPAYADVKATMERRLAEYQKRYADEPYRGAETPHPEWGPYDDELFARVEEYVKAIRATS